MALILLQNEFANSIENGRYPIKSVGFVEKRRINA
jgi:hypothetical protein